MTGVRLRVPVRFRHCDPAGIVFFPRYLEMLNDALEDLMAALGRPFDRLHGTHAVPTVRLEADFARPSRLGDVLELRLDVLELGTSSVTLAAEARAEDELRFRARQVVCWTERDPDGAFRPAPLPADLRTALEARLAPAAAAAEGGAA